MLLTALILIELFMLLAGKLAIKDQAPFRFKEKEGVIHIREINNQIWGTYIIMLTVVAHFIWPWI